MGVLAVLWLLLGSIPVQAQKGCTDPSTGLIPINDLGTGRYLGYTGGLYPDGENDPPEAHLALGIELASLVEPLDTGGNPAPDGVVVFLSIGVSNTRIEFDAFTEMAASNTGLHPRLVILNGAQGSRALDEWAVGADANPWANLDVDLTRKDLSPEQVQVVWIKLPDRTRGTVDLENVTPELGHLTSVIQIAKSKYPNLRLAYLSSRIYGGYGGSGVGEPTAYQHGFAIKWLIEQQITGAPELNANPDAGAVVAPWLAWGPYLWADGVIPRSDGLTWECEDFEEGGTHPGPGAAAKVAVLLMRHLTTDVTSTGWFLASQAAGPAEAVTTAAPTTSIMATTSTLRSDVTNESLDSRQSPSQRAGQPEPLFHLGWALAGVGFGLAVSLAVAFAVAARLSRT
ncbi:MAG: hypothetical protein LC739_06230 [Actinobacteria bacterium]|nr:hypothetical protein [Actinomycetota bacterium]